MIKTKYLIIIENELKSTQNPSLLHINELYLLYLTIITLL